MSFFTKLGFKGLLFVVVLGRFFMLCVESSRNGGFEEAEGFDISLYFNIEKVMFLLNYESLAIRLLKS